MRILLATLSLLGGFRLFADVRNNCGPCTNGMRTCQVRDGLVTMSAFQEHCDAPKTSSDYCSPCVLRAGDDPAALSKGLRVAEVGTNWVRYEVIAKGSSGEVKLWCGTAEHSCADVLELCKKSRTDNPECNGKSDLKTNSPASLK